MSTTGDWVGAFLQQARSDWQAYHLIYQSPLPVCHSLHALQMATEKLGKAALLAGGMTAHEVSKSHLAFTKFLRLASRNRNLRTEMGMTAVQLRKHFTSVLTIADEIEKLVPALSMGGVNAEYPWEEPTGNVQTPAAYRFDLAEELSTPKGISLLKDISLMVRKFEQLFG